VNVASMTLCGSAKKALRDHAILKTA